MESLSHPTSMGMFSKAGRFTSEKYIIFQKKDEILYNKKKTKHVPFMPVIEPEEQEEDIPQFEPTFKKEKEQVKKEEKKKEQISPFTSGLSREYVQKIKQIKNPPPDVGCYKPKYYQIDKAPHQVHKNKTTNRLTPKIAGNLKELMEKPISERPRPRVTGLIQMTRQIDRKPLFEDFGTPHANRFEPFEVTTTCSNFKRTKNYFFNQTIGRDVKSMYSNKEFAPDYKPNFEFSKKQLAISVPQFNKFLARKPFNKQLQFDNESYFNYDYYMKELAPLGNSQVFLKLFSLTPNLLKALPREKDDTLPFPSFMQKDMHSRLVLETLNQKMLEMNSYSDGRFQTCTSTFHMPQKTKKQKEQLDDSFSIGND